MANKIYNIGVIGCGVIWERGHWAQAIKHMPDDVKVRYVYDAQEEASRKAAEETGAAWLPDPRPMFESEDLDVVVIATPPFARVEYVRMACETGKHLMLEKPMARTIEQALEIFRLIRESGIKCHIPFARTTSADFRQLVDIINSGQIGKPVMFVHSNLAGPYSWIPLDHWMHDMELSGGPIFDYSIHFIELARACMGLEALTACYVGADTTGRVKSDDQATLILEYANGAIGQFTKSWAFPPEVAVSHQSTYVACTEGVGVLNNNNSIDIVTSEGTRTLETSPNDPPARIQCYRNLFDAIENDNPVFAGELEGLRIAEILDSALISRRSGKKEKVVIHDER
jgi:predicted dehydrogenase